MAGHTRPEVTRTDHVLVAAESTVVQRTVRFKAVYVQQKLREEKAARKSMRAVRTVHVYVREWADARASRAGKYNIGHTVRRAGVRGKG